MPLLEVRNRDRGTVLGNRVRIAGNFLDRLRGVKRTDGLDQGEGLLLSPCRAVHTFGCPDPLDVAFIDRRGRVVALYPSLAPGRMTRWIRKAEYALELPGGTLVRTDTELDDRLAWVPTPGAAEAARSDEQHPDPPSHPRVHVPFALRSLLTRARP